MTKSTTGRKIRRKRKKQIQKNLLDKNDFNFNLLEPESLIDHINEALNSPEEDLPKRYCQLLLHASLTVIYNFLHQRARGVNG